MATRKYGATTRSPTAPRAPPQRNFSSILPNLPIQFSGRLLANARPQSLDEREVLFRAGDVADGCYRLEQGLVKGSIASPQGDERILTILCPASIVRETPIIHVGPRSATEGAIRGCKMNFITHEDFD